MCVTLICCGLTVLPTLAFAQRPPGQAQNARFIDQVQIEGTQRIDPETIRSYMTIHPGDPFDPAEVNHSLKRLFATGFFSGIEILETPDRRGLIVRVAENPIVNRVAFEGNLRIKDKDIEPEVQTRPRTIHTRSKVQRDVERILDIYRRSGRFAAEVEPKLIRQPQNRVDVVFEVDEGPLTKVQRIVFVGNRQFSDRMLRSEILTSEETWWNFITTSDVYDPDRIALDLEAMRRFYLNEGYADFSVSSTTTELTADNSGFVLTFTLEEGQRYSIGRVDIESQLPAITATSLLPLLAVRPGEFYNASIVDGDVDALTDHVGEAGFAFVDIRPRLTRVPGKNVLDLVYEIGERSRVYVNRIEIEGNVRTKDEVIRREFRLAEGDAFNTSKLRRSNTRVRNLGFFESVQVTNEPSDQPDRMDIKVKVTEQSTGELSFGAGFSTTDGPTGNITLRERNLLGKGQDLKLQFEISSRRAEYDLSFTEPYFLDRELAVGFDLFRIDEDNTDESSFERDTKGLRLRGGYALSERLNQSWNYTLRRDDIAPDESASRFVKNAAGKSTTSSITHSLTWDERDNRFDPTRGYVVSMTNELTGFGGTERFVRNRVSTGWYQTLTDGVVISFLGRIGYIVGVGEDTSINQRFQIGGATLRGFEFAGVGPRDTPSGDALGGNFFTTTTAELSFPLGLPDEINIRGHLFADAGTIFGLDEDDLTDVATGEDIRASVGFGFGWRSPFGPVRVDFGFPVLKEDHDIKQAVFFNFGTQF